MSIVSIIHKADDNVPDLMVSCSSTVSRLRLAAPARKREIDSVIN